MSQRDPVQRAFDFFAKEAGLEKRSGSWYGDGDETITVSNLQRSDYGPSYYVNQAFWLKQLGDERFPKEWKCHVRARLGSMLPAARAATAARLLDLGCELSDEHREAELRDLLATHLRPIIECGKSITGLREMIADGTLRGAAIRGPAQAILGATEDEGVYVPHPKEALPRAPTPSSQSDDEDEHSHQAAACSRMRRR